jgi:type IV pilus assembly protein PilC
MPRISIGKLAGLFRRLATSYRAGLDLRAILDREAKQGAPGYQRELGIVRDEIAQGTTLASAMAKNKGAFPPLTIATVEAGEHGGRLEESFDRLAKHYENLTAFRRRLLALMAWPMFELGLSICILGLLIIILEWVTSTTNQNSIDWLGFGQNAKGENRVSSGGYLLMYMFAVVGGVGGVIVFVVGTGRGWFGTLPMRVARRIPLLGTIIVQLAMSRFAWTLGIAIDAGVNAMKSSQLALRATQNFFYARHENDVALRIRDGQEIHESLRKTGEFPEEVLIYVQNGETAGEVPEMMKHLSDSYQEKAESNMKVLAVVGFVLTFLFVAFIIIVAIFYLFINFILNPVNEMSTF